MGTAASLATSNHPVPAHAVAECAGRIIETARRSITEVLVLMSPSFAGAMEDICGAVSQLLGGARTVGVVSAGVRAGALAERASPALVVLAIAGDRPVIVASDTANRSHARVSLRLGSRPSLWDPGAYQTSTRAGGLIQPAGSAVDLEFSDSSATLHCATGLRLIGDTMQITGVERDELISLDHLPAAEVFERELAGAVGVPPDADRVGLVAASAAGASDDHVGTELVAVRRCPAGLKLSLPLDAGQSVVPAVRSPSLALAQIAQLVAGRREGPGLSPPVTVLCFDTGLSVQSLGAGWSMPAPGAVAGLELSELWCASGAADVSTRAAVVALVIEAL